MNLKLLRKIAKKFSVHVTTKSDVPGCVSICADGESVESVYFNLQTGFMRLRKPSWPWHRGDFAEAIALALTKRNPDRLKNLTRTIRRMAAA